MNKSEILLEGHSIYLKVLRAEDVKDEYLKWLQDPEVNQYLEIRHKLPADVKELKDFVSSMHELPNQFLFGIFINSNGKHIGNIKLGDISFHYERGDIGLFIGDRSCWGKGIAAESIGLVTTFAFNELKLAKVQAGAYSCNEASIRAFMKQGYALEARLKKQYKLSSGDWVDSVYLARFRE